MEAVNKPIEIHIGCGGSVSLVHEVWRCEKCNAAPVPVTETRIECLDCMRIAEEDGDILPPACAAHGGTLTSKMQEALARPSRIPVGVKLQ